MKQNQNTLNSEKVIFDGKVFFLDLKAAKNGRRYLVITQSKPIEDEKYERTKMFLFEEEIQDFSKALTNVLKDFKPGKNNGVSDAYVAKLREVYPMAFQPWTKEDEELLIALFNEGKTISELSTSFRRQEGAITARLNKLGLLETSTAA